MVGLFSRVLVMSLNGSMVLTAVLLIRFLLRRGPKGAVCLLWLAVVFRLLCPVAVEVPFRPQRGISASEAVVRDWQQMVMEDMQSICFPITDAFPSVRVRSRRIQVLPLCAGH